MAWTTPTTVNPGDAILSSLWNEQVRDNLNYLYAPPSVSVRRTANLTSYTSDTAITWSSEAWDTDTMYSSGTDITINTAGLYLVSLTGRAEGAATITRIAPKIIRNATSISEVDTSIVAGVASTLALTVLTKLAVSDVITARVLFSGGSGYVINGSATDEAQAQTRLTVQWLASVS